MANRLIGSIMSFAQPVQSASLLNFVISKKLDP